MSYQRDAKRRLRCGFIGVGGHAYRNLLPILTYLPIELVAVCDLDLPRVTATGAQYGAKAYTDAAEMYRAERLEAVFLCVGAAQHPVLAAQALAAGLHVWMEKPPARRASDLRALLPQRRDRAVVVGLKKAFMPAVAKARELMAQPGFGNLRTVLAEYPIDVPPDGRAALEAGGGNWLANGCHPLAGMHALGGAAEAVTVHRSRHSGGALIVDFSSGATGILHLANGAPASQPSERYRLVGERSAITIENCSRVEWQRGAPMQYGASTSFAPPGTDHGAVVWEAQNTFATLEPMSAFIQGMWQEMAHFCEHALAGTAPTLGTLEDAIAVMELYEAALLSGGKRVELADLRPKAAAST